MENKFEPKELFSNVIIAAIRKALVIALLSVLPFIVVAQPPQDSRDVSAVKAQEEAFRHAELHYDVKAADAIMADTFVLISVSDGKRKFKKDFLPLIGDKSDPMGALDYSDMVVNVYGDTAVVFSSVHEKFSYEGKPVEYSGPRTAVWIKRNERWLLVAIHSSSYPKTPLM